MTKKSFLIWLVLILFFLLGLFFLAFALRGAQLVKHDKHSTVVGGCDESLWARTYNPQRLKIISRCMTVTGIILDATHGKRKDGQRHEADSDNHGFLKLDAGQENLLLPGNIEAEDGAMVFECVCQ